MIRFIKPPLPYPADALEPVISRETIDYHYGKHEQAYIAEVNQIIPGTIDDRKTMEEIIRTTTYEPLFNNASQAWNHVFYFFQFSPDGRREPEGELLEKIEKQYGNFRSFKEEIERAGRKLFGSGWVWLAVDEDDIFVILKGENADTPLKSPGLVPLLTFDVWEHAYYLDYRNSRTDYLRSLWQIVDWAVIEERYRLRKEGVAACFKMQ